MHILTAVLQCLVAKVEVVKICRKSVLAFSDIAKNKNAFYYTASVLTEISQM